MTFLDRTFCASPNCEGKCGRQWTPHLQAKAEAWWGGKDAPVAFSYFCGEGAGLVEDASKKQETPNE